MHRHIARLKRILHPRAVPALARYLLHDEAISGKLILAATFVALIFANTALGSLYESFWHTNLSIGIGDWSLSQSFRDWVNEGLMTFFFLVVGLEIKREIVKDELSNFQVAILPVAAAIGGMVVPALLYMSINAGTETFRGWAIPMATDIAFAVGLLALLGRRVPSALKLFLLTLAMVDDIGAILVIALFYGSGFNIGMFLLVVAISLAVVVLAKKQRLNMPLFVVAGVGLWLAVNATGLHASVSGALLGLLAPLAVSAKTPYKRSLAERLEKFSIPVSTFFVVPLFAFANTGVILTISGFEGPALNVAWGIAVGLVIGKVVGIVGASWLMVRFTFALLPDRVSWTQMAGVGLLAGIGFTVSIFVTELAFSGNNELIDVAKLSIFAASALSGLLGIWLLKLKTRPSQEA